MTLRVVLLGTSSHCSARRANLSAGRQPQLTFLPCFKVMPIATCSVWSLHEQRTRHRKMRLAHRLDRAPWGDGIAYPSGHRPDVPWVPPWSDPTRAM